MKFSIFSLCLIISLLSCSVLRADDTVAEDMDVHQLERMVDLLTIKECQDLLLGLSHPEENIFRHLERLSEGNNPLELKPRAKRDTTLSIESEAQCRTALTDWLLTHGQQTYYDRLSRALQHIGRTDIAIEVGKNINQDKVLNLKRYVHGYHKYVTSLNIPSDQGADAPRDRGQPVIQREVKDLTWRDLDLVVRRPPLSPYQKGPLSVALPLLCGTLLGFGAPLLVGLLVLFIFMRSSSRELRRRRAEVSRSFSCTLTIDHDDDSDPKMS